MLIRFLASRLFNYSRRLTLVTVGTIVFANTSYAGGLCQGHFVNPITDICWHCLFPITIGGADVVPGPMPDTSNPSSPIQICPMPVGWRIGLAIGFWEPYALADVTRKPYCMVNMGGIQLSMGIAGNGGKENVHADHTKGAFYYVHWYKYPLIYWLNLLTSVGCMQTGDFDVAYLTELDPTWNDDEFSFVLNPEAVLFGNPIARAACAADSVAALVNHPIDALFWCMGSQGSSYPLTGHIAHQKSPIQAATLEVEKMDFKLHREGLVWDTVGHDNAVCNQYPLAIMPKSRYRYQMVNTVPDAAMCHAFGQSALTWEMGHSYPTQGNNFGFLIWKKRNCVFL